MLPPAREIVAAPPLKQENHTLQAPIHTAPAHPPQYEDEEPDEEPPTTSRRPVRQSKLKSRNFDLENVSDEEEDASPAAPPTTGGKRGPKKSGMPVGRPPKNFYQQQQPYHYAAAVPAVPMAAAGPLATLETVDVPYDLPVPRKVRSASQAQPRSSRASMYRLKQAAQGNAPLGGRDIFELLGKDTAADADREYMEGYDDSLLLLLIMCLNYNRSHSILPHTSTILPTTILFI